ncbi:MAG: hypothetical protein ABSF78_09270 [Candidatus Acidiferrales bacterium]
MVPIAFSILSAGACTFLLYVLAQFRREFVQVRKGSAGRTALTPADLCHIEPALKSARNASRAGAQQRTKNEAVMRKEILAGAVIGLAGLLAPFIFVMLLKSPWLR